MLLPVGSSKIWRFFPKASLAMAGFLVAALLYFTCPACNSKFVWISLSLGVQNSAVRESNVSTDPFRPIHSIVPFKSPPIDAPEMNARGALSALADSSPQRSRSADQIQIASLNPSPLQKEADGSFVEESLDRQPISPAKFEGEDHGGSSEDGPSSNRAESETSKTDQTAIESDIHRPGVDDVGNGLRDPQLVDVQLASPSRENEPARESSMKSHRLPRRNQNWPLKLEQDLFTAKHAIATAAKIPLSAGGDLHPPLYHNVSKFKKSYELMERMFRIFVYKEGARPLVHTGPTVGIYASEGRFIHNLRQNRQFVVKDPKKAHMFFLPYSVANMVIKLYVPNSHSMLPLTDFITSYVNMIASKHPFWNRTQGADHFFVSCHDWGPATARGHAELRQNSVKVVCNADLTEEFVLQRDISLPEIYLHKSRPPTSKQLGGPPAGRKRPYLAFFAGHMHGRVRPILLQLWKDKDPSMKIFETLPATVAKKRSYERHMKMSKFCICAMGFEVNSPRIVEAIYYDCVPVIIADNFVLPFSEVLDWTAFSLVVKEEELPLLKQILLSIPPQRYLAMQSNLKLVRQHFMWHQVQPHVPSPKYDAFHMILHSLWLTRLHSTPSAL